MLEYLPYVWTFSLLKYFRGMGCRNLHVQKLKHKIYYFIAKYDVATNESLTSKRFRTKCTCKDLSWVDPNHEILFTPNNLY